MIWPKQDTGLFAVPACVQCCPEANPNPPIPVPVTSFKVKTNVLAGYHMVGQPGADGSAHLFRTVTWSGSITSRYTDIDCTAFEASSVAEYSGTSTLALDYEGTVTGVVRCIQDGDLVGESSIINPGLIAPLAMGPSTGDASATVATLVGTGECGYIGGTFAYASSTGTATETLSNECTEDDAIGWRDANYPGYGDWMTVSVTDRLWSSTYAPSIPGMPGNYDHYTIIFNATGVGLEPGVAYSCRINLYRAAVGSSDWALYATLEQSLTADVDGQVVFEATVPLARGFKTFADAQTFTATRV